MDEISKVERRKFSIVKTVLMPVIIVAVLAVGIGSAIQVHPGTPKF